MRSVFGMAVLYADSNIDKAHIFLKTEQWGFYAVQDNSQGYKLIYSCVRTTDSTYYSSQIPDP